MAWSVDFRARTLRAQGGPAVPLPDEPALLAGSFRLANVLDLAARLGVDATVVASWSDAVLVLRLHQRFGDEFVSLLRGEWWLALWLPAPDRLLLARDASSQLPLYYAQVAGQIHFASSPAALFTGSGLPRRVNETMLLLMLSLQLGTDPGATFFEGVSLLAPGHALHAQAGGGSPWRYWCPENLPVIRYRDDREYPEQLLHLLQSAVARELAGSAHPGSMLSAGLDSSCISALAARELTGRVELQAYTHVPLAEARDLRLPMQLANEWPLAAETAQHAGNIRHHAIDSAGCHLLKAQVDPLHRTGMPSFSTNEAWLHVLYDMARQQGVDLLLNGASGNIAVSWAGCRPGLLQLLLAGEWASLRARLLDGREATPAMLLRAVAGALRRDLRERFRAPRAPHHPAMRAGLQLSPDACGQYRQDRIDPHFLGGFLAGSTSMGLRAAAYGFRTADPLADQAVIEFCLAIPPAQYASATTDRWLMRRAMARTLPEAVAQGRARGLQPVDLGWRMRQVAAEIDLVIDAMSRSELVTRYMDVTRVRQLQSQALSSPLAWQAVLDFHYALALALFLLELDGRLPAFLSAAAMRQGF